jgi:hypothetical protein
MPSFPIRLLFTATSLAPVLITYAVLYVFEDEKLTSWSENKTLALAFLGAATLLLLLCAVFLRLYPKHLDDDPFSITSLKSADRSVLAFVVAYLLPIAFTQAIHVRVEVLVFIFLILLVVVYRSDAYSVNPLLGIIGYHFYEVTTDDGVIYVVASRREIRNTRRPIKGMRISRFMFLDAEG